MKPAITTVVIVLVALVVTAWVAANNVRSRYQKEVSRALEMSASEPVDLLTEQDIEQLPGIVKKYIRRSGALGQEKVRNFSVTMKGQLRSGIESPWMPIESEQYNVVTDPFRAYYLSGQMKGLPVFGLHLYKEAIGTMNIKLLGLIEVVDQKGSEMDISDTVTLFNDLCLFAPGALIDSRITWEPVDDLHVQATFTNGANKVQALLTFKENGELLDFVSQDRYRIDKIAEKLPWSTPISEYGEIGGRYCMKKGAAVWHAPEGPYVYGAFEVTRLEYNVKSHD